MAILKPLLLAAALLSTTLPVAAQTRPVARAGQQSATSLDARLSQYGLDLTQRLREVYFAPGDGRAVALLSDAITEFTARKKGLLPELARLSPAARQQALAQLQHSAATQDRQTLLTSPAAAKMAARRQRNPALDYAFRHFDEAQLTTLEPFKAAAE